MKVIELVKKLFEAFLGPGWDEFDKLKYDLLRRDERIRELKNELEGFRHQIDYSFIPKDWKEFFGPVVTKKFYMYGYSKPIPVDVRDMFNSTFLSRKWKSKVIKEVRKKDINLDELFNRIVLEAVNLVRTEIEYKTNKAQFGKLDLWNNGDITLETREGDCDLKSRCFIRIVFDVLGSLKMYEYMKYVLQKVGYWSDVGHSWVEVYDPVKKKFNLVELTKKTKLSKLRKASDNYDAYASFGFKNIWYHDESWRNFL